MDRARFVEENGTLGNQMGALSGERDYRVYSTSHGVRGDRHPSDRYTPVKKVWIPLTYGSSGTQVRYEIRGSHASSVNLSSHVRAPARAIARLT